RHTRFSRDWSSDVCSSDLGSLRIFRMNSWESFEFSDLIHSAAAAFLSELMNAIDSSSAAMNDLYSFGFFSRNSEVAQIVLKVPRSEERREGNVRTPRGGGL